MNSKKNLKTDSRVRDEGATTQFLLPPFLYNSPPVGGGAQLIAIVCSYVYDL